ncbi:MAG: hypothetical protein IJL59_03115 [Clostridia bacterium]|nr:hypothetical protein [Clostridia bacterium]
MMKKFLILAISLLFALSLFACGAKEATPAQPTAAPAASYRWDFVKKTTGIDDLKVECDQKGTIEELAYETPLYISDASTIVTKHLWVYLPYGYDQSKSYNVLYLMHGGGETEIYWLAGERWGPTTRNVLDNMIKNGVCDPFIVVTPTFYPPEGNYENPEGAEQLTYVFADELRNQIVPLVETKYSTYANGDVSEANLAATRDHRAFAGFSMGSMTSIHSALMKNLDLFAWVGSYSGAKTEVKDFQDALNAESVKALPIKFWYNGNGKADIAHDEHDEFCHGVVEAMPERFTDGENFAWVDLRDGSHAYQSWLVDLYNCMLVFFK